MSGKRVCPKCSVIVGEFTYFCTECGAKTEEYREQPHQMDSLGSKKSFVDSQIQEIAAPRAIPVSERKNISPSPVPWRKNTRTLSREEVENSEQSHPLSSQKDRTKFKYIVLGAACIIAATGILTGLYRGGSQGKKSEMTKNAVAVPVQTEKTAEIQTEARTSTAASLAEYIDVNEPDDSQETAIVFNASNNASDYILPVSDSVYLTEKDLKALTKDELRLARNELYARHGRLFKDEQLQAYFNAFDWYDGRIEPDKFSDSLLNSYEIANRDLIVAYEEKMGYR